MGQLTRQIENGRKINIENRIPVFVAHAHKQAIARDASIVDQNVNAAHFLFRLLTQGLDGFAVRKIGRKDEGAVAKFSGKLFQLFFARAVQADDCALRMKSAGNRFAKTAGCAGYQSLAASQIKHVGSF